MIINRTWVSWVHWSGQSSPIARSLFEAAFHTLRTTVKMWRERHNCWFCGFPPPFSSMGGDFLLHFCCFFGYFFQKNDTRAQMKIGTCIGDAGKLVLLHAHFVLFSFPLFQLGKIGSPKNNRRGGIGDIFT